MSKFVKRLISRDISHRLDGVNDAMVANIVGMTGDENYAVRKALREKGLSLLVVKRTLAAMATEGTSLRRAFDDHSGSIAVIWGGEDFV
ncbi:MAG: 50S ribosomal protein L10, partial [Pirellula sp.]